MAMNRENRIVLTVVFCNAIAIAGQLHFYYKVGVFSVAHVFIMVLLVDNMITRHLFCHKFCS